MDIMAIKPDAWGSSAWKFLHYTALAYPENPTEEEKKNYMIFFTSLEHVLPCPTCAKNFKGNLEKFPLEEALTNNQLLFQWTVNIHNEVNKELSKKEYSYKEALDIYINPHKEQYDIIFIIGLFILIGFILFYMNRK